MNSRSYKMQIEIIQVSDPVTRPGSTGDYQTIEIAYKRQGKIEGKKIVSFNYGEVYDLLCEAQPGEFYDVTTKKNEKNFWDWTKAKQIDEITEVANVETKKSYAPKAAGAPGAAKQWVPDEDKQRLIVRQSCIKSAVELLGHFGDAKNQKEALASALDLGEVFVMWVYQDIKKVAGYNDIKSTAVPQVEAPKKRGRPARVQEEVE